jgi:putative Mg2+ transporter-C (MgtC) family protein
MPEMQDLLDQFAQQTWLPFPVIAARLLLASLLGAAIGFEREWRKRPAGLRTHMLVCLAASLIAVIAVELVHNPAFIGQNIRIDAARTISAVTSGVAFLAAGFIVFSRGRVHGLTTGAGLWLAAAVGLSCGLGYWQVGGFAALLALIVLGLLRILEVKFEAKDSQREGGAPDRRTERPDG